MKSFNYEKAYFTQVLPAYQNMNVNQKNAHDALRPMVKDLTQRKGDLCIPVSDKIKEILSVLTCQEIAEMARASGESWKIANVCDQVLRERLAPLPYNIQIYEGKLRVTFSSKDCWLWNEFGLATEKNLDIFKNCKLRFNEDTIDESAKKLSDMCGDLWPDVDSIPDNEDYANFLKRKNEHKIIKLKERHADKLKKIEKDIENSKIELKAFTWMIENGLGEYIDNCIYYDHENCFCFGWRDKLTDKEKDAIREMLHGFQFTYMFK